MCLDVLLKILWPLERLAAEIALVGLQRHMNTDVRRDVVTLDSSRAALVPLARQVEVVGALAANMTLADVVLILLVEVLAGDFFLYLIILVNTYVKNLGGSEALAALAPAADEVVLIAAAAGGGHRRRGLRSGGGRGGNRDRGVAARDRRAVVRCR